MSRRRPAGQRPLTSGISEVPVSPWAWYSFPRLLTLRLQLVVPSTVRRTLQRTPGPRLAMDEYPIPDRRTLHSLLLLRSLSVMRAVLLYRALFIFCHPAVHCRSAFRVVSPWIPVVRCLVMILVFIYLTEYPRFSSVWPLMQLPILSSRRCRSSGGLGTSSSWNCWIIWVIRRRG